MTPTQFLTPYKSAHSLAQIVKVLLLAGVAINFLEILGAGVSALFPAVTGDEELGENAGGLVVILLRFGLGLLSGGVYITTAILFLIWLHRSSKNVTAFGTGPLSYSPGWVVGSFFIPFANLFLPFRAVREIWQNSFPPEDNRMSAPSTPVSFGLWWGFWIACCIAGNAAFRAERRGVSDSAVEIAGVISEVLTIVAGLLAFLVVGEIDKRQEETSQRLRLGNFAAPPPPAFSNPAEFSGFPPQH